MLNIRKAFELAKLLQHHIPDELDTDILDFVGKIVSSIRQSDEPEIFAESLILMYDLSDDQIAALSGIDAIKSFTIGLQENKIVSLKEFYLWVTKL
jgi:hypothetical protein